VDLQRESLWLELLDRERRLHALTEQSLQILDRLSALRAVLAEREQWIAALLHEVSGRRFKLRRRALAAHERRFLAEVETSQRAEPP
jgi:hypothetical protein